MILDNIFKGMSDAAQVIQRNFDKLKSEHTDSGTILAVTSGVTPDAGKPLIYFKEGRWVHFIGGGTFPTVAGTIFLIMPAGFRPIDQDIYFTTTVRDSDTTRKCVIQVLKNGECRIITNSFSGNPVFLDNFHYRTAVA